MNDIITKWQSFSPYLRSILRMVVAVLFMMSGSMKLFAFPVGVPPDGGTVPFMSEAWIAGFLEVFGGFLFLIGLFTRPVAFILSGEMAVAYFQFHAPKGFWPIVNGGDDAILYCFIFLFYSAPGSSVWSL